MDKGHRECGRGGGLDAMPMLKVPTDRSTCCRSSLRKRNRIQYAPVQKAFTELSYRAIYWRWMSLISKPSKAWRRFDYSNQFRTKLNGTDAICRAVYQRSDAF